MSQTKVSKTYAKSLLELSVQNGILEQVNKDMSFLYNTCSASNELQLLLSSPVVSSDKKISILNSIFDGKISSLTLSFVQLMTKKGREALIVDVSSSFANLYLEHKNILKAVIHSVDGVGDSLKQKVKDLVRQSYNKEVLIEEIKDPSLLGGFIITVGDKQIDSSIAKQLAILKNNFSENPYISHL